MNTGEEMKPFVLLVLFELLSISEVLPHQGFLQEEQFDLHLNLSKGTTGRKYFSETCHLTSFASLLLNVF